MFFQQGKAKSSPKKLAIQKLCCIKKARRSELKKIQNNPFTSNQSVNHSANPLYKPSQAYEEYEPHDHLKAQQFATEHS